MLQNPSTKQVSPLRASQGADSFVSTEPSKALGRVAKLKTGDIEKALTLQKEVSDLDAKMV